jgi:hypothetical protein
MSFLIAFRLILSFLRYQFFAIASTLFNLLELVLLDYYLISYPKEEFLLKEEI